jgi:hypothetical protein
MNMLEVWALLLVGVLVAGIIGRRRFSKRTKLWLWRVGFVFAAFFNFGNQQDYECRAANLTWEECRRLPITAGTVIQWGIMAGLLYLVYRFATRKLRKAIALERGAGAAEATGAS